MNNDQNKKIVLFIATLGAFVVPFMMSSVNVALPSISKELSMSTVALSWISLSYSLATAIFVFPFGRLADILGRKKLLLWGMIGLSISSALCGLTFNSAMLIIARVLQGISGATVSVTVVSILTSVYPPGERGKVLGLNVAMTYAGLSTGPFLGGLLTEYLGWRSIFIITVVLLIIVVVLLLNLKQEWAEATDESFDYKGAAIYGIALFGIVCGFSLIRSLSGIILMVIGFIALIVFYNFETKVEHPIMDMNLLKENRILTFSSLAALINYSATSALSYLLSLYLQYIKVLDPTQAGLILMAQPVVMALFSPVAGRISDRIEPQKVASIGMAITAAGLAFFIFLSQGTSVIYIVAGLLTLGFGFALFSSPNTNAVMSSVEKRYYGVASGILGAARTVGQTFSLGITSLIMALYMGNESINASNQTAFIGAVKVTFSILTVLCIAGIFASVARGKINRSGQDL
ncbi:multidrug resistance protein Stp [Oxobacter pfennigii]|uniref:Multidrug resistance protein Stp n=1 Tax=Oxobacter pfennigii TaxID=36849 RepID=A0A0P8WCV6_9CLOT|nr:multidrug resistance protein Stp [Oxobacter pfennigii]